MRPNILISSGTSNCDNYIAAVAAAGGKPVPAYCPGTSGAWDGLLLCGGDDIDPSCFGQENCGSKRMDQQRDRAELALVHYFLTQGLPILGICRGHQMLNVALGGNLIQDIADELKPFHTYESCGGYKVHPIRVAEGSILHSLYGPCFFVNSGHHQAVEQLGRGLAATAWSESGLIEAVELEGAPVLGVQFHPERMTGVLARTDTVEGGAIFRWFLSRCATIKRTQERD